MAILGEIKRADEVGHPTQKGSKYIWAACIICGKERGVDSTFGKPSYDRCFDCANKAKRGVPNPKNSKGYKTRHTQGYIMLNKPEHHHSSRQGYVMEHIVIWETVNNRKLPEGWLIHHLNGIKDDNRPENLVAMKHGEHVNYAEPFKKRIRSLEADIELLEKALRDNHFIFRVEEN